MIKTIKKDDFTSRTLRELQSGDIIMVLNSTYKEYDSTCSQIRLFKKRNPLPEGVSEIKVETDPKTYMVHLTIL